MPDADRPRSRPRRFLQRATRRWRALARETGATMVEYSLMVGLIAAVAAAAVTTLGIKVSELFQTIATPFP